MGRHRLPIPTVRAAQLESIIQQVAAYIAQQRETYRNVAAPLSLEQRGTLRHFFLEPTLNSARLLVLTRQRVANPPFYRQLIEMGLEAAALPDFERMAAITFVDTVVSYAPFTLGLLFHELVHVVQYEQLGVGEFAARYVRGFLNGGSYAAIPLEMNAYGLEARFASSPTLAFSVNSEVQKLKEAGKF